MIKLTKENNAYNFYTNEMTRLDLINQLLYGSACAILLRATVKSPDMADTKVFVSYYTKDNIAHQINVTSGMPFPNKSLVSPIMRIGRKKTRKWIPIIFNDYAELSKVERLQIIWYIPSMNHVVIVNYRIGFKDPVQKGLYPIWTFEDLNYDLDYDETISKIHTKLYREDHGYDKVSITMLKDGIVSKTHEFSGCTHAYSDTAFQKAKSELNPDILSKLLSGEGSICIYDSKGILKDDLLLI